MKVIVKMRLKIIVNIVLVILIAVIQTTILEHIKIMGVKPNLLICYTVCYAIINGMTSGAIAGFMCGAVQDVLSGRVLWLNSLIGMYAGFITGTVNRRFYRDSLLIAVVATFIISLVYGILFYMLMKIPDNFNLTRMAYILKNIILPESVYNSAASVLMFVIVLKLDSIFTASE